MKKLIAIAVVFALVAGGVFAADLGAAVFGTVNLFEGSTIEDSEVEGSAGMGRIRLEGSGENDDGNFGAWIRVDAYHWQGSPNFEGLAWWKPIDQFKLAIGGNSDGIYGKEGYSGWMFHQTANDSGVVADDQAWSCAYTVGGETMRDAFYGGFGGRALMLEIKPVDMFGLNIVLPYFDKGHGFGGTYYDEDLDADLPWWKVRNVGDVFKNMTIQADVNLDFGNIALTFEMQSYDAEDGENDGTADKIGGKVSVYFGLSAVDNLSLDVGIGIPFPKTIAKNTRMDPIGIGVAAKYSVNDAFGIKARVLARFMGGFTPDGGDKDPSPFGLIFDILPYYSISDSMTIFADIGINMKGEDSDADGNKQADSVLGFHFNPYIQVGSEWGPSFFAGVKVYTDGTKVDDKDIIKFAVPIGLEVSF